MEGVAPDVQLATIGASGTDQDYYRSVAVGYHQALAAGVRIFNNSWGDPSDDG